MDARPSRPRGPGARTAVARAAIGALALALAGCATAPRAATRAQLEARVKAAPKSAGALRDLAWAEYFDGEREAAGVAFARALAIDGNDARTLFGTATLADEEGRFGEARELYARVLETAAAAANREGAPSSKERDPFRPAVEVAAAAAIERLTGEAPGEAALAARLARLDAGRLDPDAAAHLLSARASLARRAGSEAEASRLDIARGCPEAVLTAGPYGHLPRLDLERAFGPDGQQGKPEPGPDGVVARAPVRGCGFHVQTPQARPGVAYAVTWVRAPRRTTATVAVALDQPWLLIVDGVVIHRMAPEDRYPPRVFALDVPLRSGWHRVTLKLAAPGPRTSAGLRIAAPEPLEFATEPPPGGRGGTGRAPNPREVRPHRAAPIPAGAAAAEPRLAAYLAALAALRHVDLEAGAEAVARLKESAPKFVPGLLVAALLAAGDPSRPSRLGRDAARRDLEAALALDPRCVVARYELSQLDVQDEHADKALARLAAAPSAAAAGSAGAPPAATAAATATGIGGSAGAPSVARPNAPSWRLPFARFVALRARGWLVEAERAIAEAEVADPEACAPREGEEQLALDRRDPGRARRLAAGLVQCAPDSEELARLEREAGHAAAAAAEYRRLVALDPTRPSLRAALGEQLMAAGDTRHAVEVFRELVARDPLVAQYRRQLADALLAADDEAGARRVLLDGLTRSPEASDLQRALAALGEPGAMDPWRLDGHKVIAAFEASGTRYDSPAVIVLDRTVTRVFPNGARLTLTHNIVRVQTKDGIDKWGEVQVPEGADVLLLRTVKSDGTTREPEEIAEKQSTSVPDLQPGDYVEFEYVDPAGPPQAFPNGFLGERFYFQSFDAPLDRTEYVVVTPRGMALQIDRRGAPPAVRLETRGDLEVRTWSDRRKAQLVPEPQQAPFTEYVPSVRVAAGLSFGRWRDFLLDQQFGTRRANPELRALAKRLKTPHAIDTWARRNIKQGGSLDEPATAVLAAGQGSRVVLERALLAAIGFRSTVWLARARTDAVLDGSPLPDLESFDEALLAVEEKAGRAPLVTDPRFRHAPTGFVAPLLRGMPALALSPGPDEPKMVRVPGALGEGDAPAATSASAVPSDDRRVRVEAKLDADGAADVTVVETLRGWPAVEWREALDRINEDRIRAEFEQRTLGFYFPGATLNDLEFGPRDDDDAPFVVRYVFRAPRLARAEGRELVLPAPFPALLGKRYVGMAERSTPMQLLYAAPTTLEASVTLPAGASAAPGRAIEQAASSGSARFGSFSQAASVAGGVLRLRATFAMPPVRVPASAYDAFRRYADTVDQAEERAATVQLAGQAAQ